MTVGARTEQLFTADALQEYGNTERSVCPSLRRGASECGGGGIERVQGTGRDTRRCRRRGETATVIMIIPDTARLLKSS